MKLDARIPSGPIEQRWDRCRFEMKLVNPANKRKYSIIVVGTGLAGGSAAASLGEAADLVLDAGPAPGGMPSTVVKAGPDGCAILRAGAIPAAAIWAAAGRALNPEPGTPSGHP